MTFPILTLIMLSPFVGAGVILLMFGVGLHFNMDDLFAVKGVAIPGAIAQTSAATVFGILVAGAFGFPLGAGAIMGLGLGVASTVVLVQPCSNSTFTPCT